MFESKNSFIYILLSIRVPIEKKNKILFSHFILFFKFILFSGMPGWRTRPVAPVGRSGRSGAQSGAVGRSAPPQWAAETAPAAMPIFFYNRPMPKWPVARPSIWVLAVVCFFGGVRLAV